jgi:hypothetical protein
MKKSIYVILITALSIMFMAQGCTSSSGDHETAAVGPEPKTVDPVIPNDATEPELMALCVSGELTPPSELVGIFNDDLIKIRGLLYAEESVMATAPNTSITFSPPWAPGKISIGFDPETLKLVEEGKYNEWDGLNGKFSVKKINIWTMDIQGEISGSVSLSFNDTSLHPRRIAEQYALLPGVNNAHSSGIIGDRSNIYPLIVSPADGTLKEEDLADSTRYYLFREGSEDCPSGCINNIYWMFVVEGNSVTCLGSYNPSESEEKPQWWETAQKAIDAYRTY